jgi:hypothetical protein
LAWNVHNENAPIVSDLRRCQSSASSAVHRLDQVVNQLLKEWIHDLSKAALRHRKVLR